MVKKRDTSKKRESILDAAVEVFQIEGYETASMDRIAEVASASKRTVYNHFESKEKLFMAVIERFIAETCSAKQITYDPTQSVEEQLGQFAALKISLLDNPSWMGVMKVTLGVFIKDSNLAKQTMELSAKGADHLVSWLEEAKADKKITFENANVTAQIFWSMVSGALFWPRLFGMIPEDVSLDAMKEEMVKTFLARFKS